MAARLRERGEAVRVFVRCPVQLLSLIHIYTIPQYIEKICKRDPFSGHTVTGGIVTVKDSSWLLSWTLNRQQQFRDCLLYTSRCV